MDLNSSKKESELQTESCWFKKEICSPDKCTACFACQAVCLRDAIDICTGTDGRTFPVINPEKCVRCGACHRACPQGKGTVLAEPLHCYAAQAADADSHRKSSSGAIAALLTQIMLMEGAVVYGSVSEGTRARHIGTCDPQEAEAFRGSKYVQSDMDGVVRKIRQELKAGKTIAFFGTPCQVAGVRAAAGTESERLYCIDLICHGVPPAAYLEQHLKKVCGRKKIDRFSFRGGEDDFFLKAVNNKGTAYRADKTQDTYYYAFMQGMSFRQNCYQCQYATDKRIGDLTIGDFWGLNRKTMKTKQSGRISVALVNNKKGEQLWERIRDQLIWEERPIEEAVKGNPNLRRPSKIPCERKKFLNKYAESQDFDRAFITSGISRKWKKDKIKQSRIYKVLQKTKKRLLHLK